MFHQVLSIFFSLFLLFADSGQMLYAHTCHHANRTTFSVNEVEVCCGSCESEEVAEVISSSSCCDIQTQWLKQNYLTDTQGQTPLQINSPILYVIAQEGLMLQLPICHVALPAVQTHSPPPLLFANSDIRFTQSFRI